MHFRYNDNVPNKNVSSIFLHSCVTRDSILHSLDVLWHWLAPLWRVYGRKLCSGNNWWKRIHSVSHNLYIQLVWLWQLNAWTVRCRSVHRMLRTNFCFRRAFFCDFKFNDVVAYKKCRIRTNGRNQTTDRDQRAPYENNDSRSSSRGYGTCWLCWMCASGEFEISITSRNLWQFLN